MSIANKYRIKDNITKEDIIKELKEKRLPLSENGTYISKDAKFNTFTTLADDIEVCVAFPEDLSTWDSYEHVLVLDDSICQPYMPFYIANENPNKAFTFVLNVIGSYNKFMDSLSFLERVQQ